MSSTSDVPAVTLPFSVSMWMNIDTAGSNHVLFFIGNQSQVDEYFALRAAGNVAGDPIRVVDRNGSATSADTTTGFTAGVWCHVACTFVGTAERHVWLDGGSKGTGTTSKSGHTASINIYGCGRWLDSSPATVSDGQCADLAIWDSELSDADVAALAAGLHPYAVQPESLVRFFPFHGTGDPEVCSVSGATLTLTGSPPATEHPYRVPQPWWSNWTAEAGAAPGGFLPAFAHGSNAVQGGGAP